MCKKIIYLIFPIFLFVLIFAFAEPKMFLKHETTSADAHKTIVLDAGHGEPDGGAVGKSGVPESEINLSIAKLAEEKLKNFGLNVIMTRSDSKGLHKTEDASVKTKKREDLNERVKIANESGADMFLSIHMNYFGERKYSGPQIFYTAKSNEARTISENLMKCMKEKIGEHCTREIKPVEKGIYVLEKISIPAVLVECGFLSNQEEEALLLSKEYQDKMAEAIACGVASYIGLNN